MDLKLFKEIAPSLKMKLYHFIKNKDFTYNKSYIQMTKIYESDTFNHGKSVFILFDKGEVKGSVALITKEISIKGEAYITDVYIEIEDAKILLKLLIERAVEYCILCNSRSIKIRIGEGETHLISHMKELEFNHIYDTMIMTYKGNEHEISEVKKEIEMVPLSIANSKQYMDIQNEAFKNSPNGGSIDEVEVKDYIVLYADKEDLIGLFLYKGKPCGIYELSISEDIGWIDTIGISPKHHKKGFGTILITECIKKLSEKKVNEVKLLVITTNDIAVKAYKKNRFENEKVSSYWFEKI